MSTFDRISELKSSDGPQAAIGHLIETLRAEKNHHRLFDAMLLGKKIEMGLPVINPTSLDDVPEEKRKEFEEHYVNSAREVGKLMLENDQLSDAWVYFRTIQEPEVIAEALEHATLPDDYEKSQELINIALYEGANPVRGLEFLLQSNGTCNTITALDQAIAQFSEADRRKSAAIMVKHLYDELTATVKSELDQRLTLPPGAEPQSLRELIMGREQLFQEGNYHVDVSHLSSVVRFARFLDGADPELQLAIQLAEYGSKLDTQFQYPGEPPFEDPYPAHIHFFNILTGQHADEGIAYFQQQLDNKPDEADQQMIAYVIVDLLVRTDRLDKALEVAEKHLRFLEEPTFSFADLCNKAGKLDVWANAAKENGDLVGYTAAILQSSVG
jgi:tetratricopeptide (TPR) repeat protein